VEWLMVQVLSSNSSTTKKKKLLRRVSTSLSEATKSL
jgi:hypothetical protein